ncbi:MAG TPA: PIN domain-containing protein [Bryobacteraceae bacterium]|jgi:hypothetical protein
MKRVLADTGPLVAILSPADQFHGKYVDALKSLVPPLYTCWSVITEAAWLLREDPEAVEALLRGGGAGFYKILDLGEQDAESIAALLKRYRNLRPRVVDASLVHLAQREGIDTIFTLDQRDFRVYRPAPHRFCRILP